MGNASPFFDRGMKVGLIAAFSMSAVITTATYFTFRSYPALGLQLGFGLNSLAFGALTMALGYLTDRITGQKPGDTKTVGTGIWASGFGGIAMGVLFTFKGLLLGDPAPG